jgi:hypothetical protein
MTTQIREVDVRDWMRAAGAGSAAAAAAAGVAQQGLRASATTVNRELDELIKVVVQYLRVQALWDKNDASEKALMGSSSSSSSTQ